jgi:hypothetical protein
MLIYTRVATEDNLADSSRNTKNVELVLKPPSEALQVVQELNESHDKICKDYSQRCAHR